MLSRAGDIFVRDRSAESENLLLTIRNSKPLYRHIVDYGMPDVAVNATFPALRAEKPGGLLGVRADIGWAPMEIPGIDGILFAVQVTGLSLARLIVWMIDTSSRRWLKNCQELVRCGLSIHFVFGWSRMILIWKSFTPDKQHLIVDSGKLRVLDSLLHRLKDEGHRVLIYSLMTKMMDILEEFMIHKHYPYIRLDGSSKISDRRDMVKNFQSRDDIFVFLLSTRAGGLGINLTAADTVSARNLRKIWDKELCLDLCYKTILLIKFYIQSPLFHWWKVLNSSSCFPIFPFVYFLICYIELNFTWKFVVFSVNSLALPYVFCKSWRIF